MGVPVVSNRNFRLFSLIMIAVISVDSLRNLPIAAQYGFSLITLYVIAGLLFFLPLSWVSSRLATEYPKTGGSYNWISAAFGNSWGMMGIWLQWIYNMIWYPTIFAFAVETLLSMIYPSLVNNVWCMYLPSLIFFWCISYFHAKGIRIIGLISTPSAIIGVLIPMLVLILMAAYWILDGNPSATPFSWQALIPDSYVYQNLSFFSNILFSLLGIEVIAMHAGNVINPRTTYPRAFLISGIMILLSIIAASTALIVILPAQKIGLVAGVGHVLENFFAAYHIQKVTLAIGICIIAGSLGIAASWMVGMARGLHVAMEKNNGPQWLLRLNKNEMPANILFIQSIVYSILLTLFFLFPDINKSYWILSAVTAQFALLYYILLFSAAMKLFPGMKLKGFNKILAFILPILAIMVCMAGIVAGFLPPESLQVTNKKIYIWGMISGFMAIGLVIIWIVRYRRINK